MIGLVLAVAILGADPKTVDVANYVGEVEEVFKKADAEQNPAKAAAIRNKELQKINAKYKKSKTAIVLTRAARDIPEKSMQVVLERPSELDGIQSEIRYDNFFMWKDFVSGARGLEGKAVRWTGVPQLVPGPMRAIAGRNPNSFWWGDNKARINVQLLSPSVEVIDAPK